MHHRQNSIIFSTQRMLNSLDIDVYLDDYELPAMDIIINIIISKQLKFYGESAYLGVYFINGNIKKVSPISNCKIYNKYFVEAEHCGSSSYVLYSNKALTSLVNTLIYE